MSPLVGTCACRGQGLEEEPGKAWGEKGGEPLGQGQGQEGAGEEVWTGQQEAQVQTGCHYGPR